MLHQNSLERIIKRFKISEICPALERWGYLTKKDIEEVRTAGSKQQMISEICERCEGQEIDEDAIGELDILNVQLHSKLKTWNVYELTDAKEEEMKTSVSPIALQRRMSRDLGQYFDSDVSTKVLDKALWIRFSLQHGIMGKGTIKFSSDVIYIVHYPRTNFFISTSIKATFRKVLIKNLVSVLGYFNSKEMQLKGHSLTSLAEIVLNRNSHGGFSRHRTRGDDVNPLTYHHPQKRKEPEEEKDERITREDDRKRQKRMDALENTFGPYVQPTLEKVEFKLETRFRGFTLAQDRLRNTTLSRVESFFPIWEQKYQNTVDSEVFKCRVKFEGKNVLEGLRNLGKRGLASVPLPRHLTSITSQARNYFILGERTRNSRGLRSPAPA